MSATSRIAIVVPCFNEEARLPRGALVELLADPLIDLVLVDDGSTDATRAVLEAFAASSDGRARVVSLERNGGKGEAVRRGLLAAVAHGANAAAYVDADFATPASEILRLVRELTESDADVVLAARVAGIGAKIARRPSRHYLGRVFSTAASFVLGAQIYDTQCGAKVFRVSAPLERALAHPFRSRWVFDVELLARLREADDGLRLLQLPLQEWREVAGSKLRVSGMLRSALDLATIAVDVRRARTVSRTVSAAR